MPQRSQVRGWRAGLLALVSVGLTTACQHAPVTATGNSSTPPVNETVTHRTQKGAAGPLNEALSPPVR